MRIGIASQTPFARLRRSVAALEAERGPLGDPIPLQRLVRGEDYSVTPGGVGRMIGALVESGRAAGEWVTLDGGAPRDLALGPFRLGGARLPPSSLALYGRAKEVVWEAINGRPPAIRRPLASTSLLDALALWPRAADAALAERAAGSPFDVVYANDWQHLAHAALTSRGPNVMHLHAPFAPWVPDGWREYLLAFLRRFDAVVVSTPSYRRGLEAAGLGRPVHAIWPWLDLGDHPRVAAREVAELEERLGLDPEDEVVVHVGRMDPVKGQDGLVAAFSRVAIRRPRARLLLVGNGSFSSSERGIGLPKGGAWRARLERLSRDLGVRDRVLFAGHLPHALALPAFARADVFAFPSVGEGFGLAVVEAWLQRRAVVVSRRAGVREVVRHGGNGLLADATDPRAFAGAIERLLADRSLAERMGEEGQRTARATSDARRRIPELIEVLEATVEERRADLAAPVESRRARARGRRGRGRCGGSPEDSSRGARP